MTYRLVQLCNSLALRLLRPLELTIAPPHIKVRAAAVHRFIDPGKPMQNCFIQILNVRLREECLNARWFVTLADARRKIEAWRRDYNEERPHSSLGYLAPQQFAQLAHVGAQR